MSDEIELFAGRPGDDDGEGYMPRIALDHGPTDSGYELYVIVGEEVEGMAEGVDAPTFEAIRACSPEAVRAYLDEAIVRWRELRDTGVFPAGMDASAVALAPAYIDAFQSVRASLLGATLP